MKRIGTELKPQSHGSVGGPAHLSTVPAAAVKGAKPVEVKSEGFVTAKQVEQQRIHEPVPMSPTGIGSMKELQQVRAGDFTTLKGKVINKDPLKINNDGPPGGAYLELDHPVVFVDTEGKRFEVREIFISLDNVTQQGCGTRGNNCGSCSMADSCMVGKKLPDDRSMTLYGKLGSFDFGGDGFGKAPGFVVGMGGASVQGKDRKEPMFKADNQFHDAVTGAALESLTVKNPDIPNSHINRPANYRHPDAQMVFAKEPVPKQPDRMVVWVGKSGGGANPLSDFHGFSDFHVPRTPTADEIANIKFQDKGEGAKGDFTADSSPRVKKGKAWQTLEPLGLALGHEWFLDRSGRKAYGLTMKKAPESGFELSKVIPFNSKDFIAGAAADPPFGYFQTPDGKAPIDGREEGIGTPRDEMDQDKRTRPVWIARRIDPKKVEGPGGWYSSFIGPTAKDPEVPIYGPLAAKAGKDGLVSPDDFKKSLREIVAAQADGPEVIAKLEKVMTDAEEEYKKGRAAAPPADKGAWFDFLLDSYLHSHDLRVWMKALGFASNSVAGHDMTEMVPLKDVEWQMKGRYVEPWFKSWVDSEATKGAAEGKKPDEIMVNCSFLNPNYAAAGYLWGYASLGANDIMNLHRLSCHHSGNTHEEIFWVEKAMNFMIHHVPLEDFGVRHEEAGMFTKLVADGVMTKEDLDPKTITPEKMFVNLGKALDFAEHHDPAMKSSEIGQAIIADAFPVWKELAQRGFVQPWQLARPRASTNEYPLTPKLESSYRQLQLQTRAAKQMFDQAAGALTAQPTGAPRALFDGLKAMRDTLSTAKYETAQQCKAEVDTQMAAFRAVRDAPGADPAIVDAAAHATLAAFGMVAVFNENAANAFSAPTAELEAALKTPPPPNAPSTFLPKEEILRSIEAMRTVPEKAELAKKNGQEVLSNQVMDIYRYWQHGFLSVDGAPEGGLAASAL